MSDFDVIIPTKDRAELTLRAIESVRCQELRASRIVVVDDGSAESELDSLASGLRPDEVLVRLSPSHGASAARNAGIDACSSRTLLFLDSDDLWLPNHASTVMRLLPDAGGVVVAGSVTVAAATEPGHRGRVTVSPSTTGPKRSVELAGDEGIGRLLAGRAPLTAGSCLGVRRNALTQEVRFDTSLTVMEDMDLVAQFLLAGTNATFSRTITVIRDGSGHDHLYSIGRAAEALGQLMQKWAGHVPLSNRARRRILLRQLRLAAMTGTNARDAVSVPWPLGVDGRTITSATSLLQRATGSRFTSRVLRVASQLPGRE